jgi:hypothetical protein
MKKDEILKEFTYKYQQGYFDQNFIESTVDYFWSVIKSDRQIQMENVIDELDKYLPVKTEKELVDIPDLYTHGWEVGKWSTKKCAMELLNIIKNHLYL